MSTNENNDGESSVSDNLSEASIKTSLNMLFRDHESNSQFLKEFAYFLNDRGWVRHYGSGYTRWYYNETNTEEY